MNLEGEINPEEVKDEIDLGKDATAASVDASSQVCSQNGQTNEVEKSRAISDFLLSQLMQSIDQDKIKSMS
jgi:hypothetical protein